MSWVVTAARLSALLLSLFAGSSIAQQAPLPAVTVATVAEGSIERRVTFTGRVEAVNKVELRARVEGFLEAREFTEGQPVTAGQRLFAIERGLYEAAVKEVQGQLKSAEGAAKVAELERDRQATLVQRQAAAQAVLDDAEASLTEAQGRVLQLEGSLQRAQLELSYTEIMAPFDGEIGLATADVGDYVNAQSEPLAVMVSVDPMYVTFPITEAELLRARAKRKAQGKSVEEVRLRIILADGTTYPETGNADFLNVEVDQGTDTVLARGVMPNPEGDLIDGQFVRVRLELEAEQDLVVPLAAIQRDRDGTFVLRVDDTGKVEQTRVELGSDDGGHIAVVSGLNAGDRVIVEGANKVRDGMTVDAAEAEPALDTDGNAS